MGSGPKVKEFDPKSRGYETDFMSYLNYLQGGGGPSDVEGVETPDQPFSQQAAERMNASIGRYGGDIEKMLYGMMMGGGRQDVSNITDAMRQRGQQQDAMSLAQLKESGIPLNSTAMTRAAMGQLGQNQLDRNIGIGQLELGAMENAMDRQFRGAQGMQSMPGYYAQPTSIEQAMLGLGQQYDMANLQNRQFNAQQETQNQQVIANMLNNLLANNWYQPERMVEPSNWQKYGQPLLSVAGGIGAGIAGNPMLGVGLAGSGLSQLGGTSAQMSGGGSGPPSRSAYGYRGL